MSDMSKCLAALHATPGLALTNILKISVCRGFGKNFWMALIAYLT